MIMKFLLVCLVHVFLFSMLTACAAKSSRPEVLRGESLSPQESEWVERFALSRGVPVSNTEAAFYFPSRRVCMDLKNGVLDTAEARKEFPFVHSFLPEERWYRSGGEGYLQHFLSYEKFLGAVEYEPARSPRGAGRIYQKGNLRFILEEEKGVHIQLPSAPEDSGDSETDYPKSEYSGTNKGAHSLPESFQLREGFLKIPGAGDLVVLDDFLYVSSYEHLFVFDLAQGERPALVSFAPSLFTSVFLPEFNGGQDRCVKAFSAKGMLREMQFFRNRVVSCVDGEPSVFRDFQLQVYKDNSLYLTHEKCPEHPGIIFTLEGAGNFNDDMPGLLNGSEGGAAPGAKAGISGALNRFAPGNKRLFFADRNGIQILNVDTLYKPWKSGFLGLNEGADLEMLHFNQRRLFAGSSRYTYLIDAGNEDSLGFAYAIPHLTPLTDDLMEGVSLPLVRDPVVVQDSLAYVTLRTRYLNRSQREDSQYYFAVLQSLVSSADKDFPQGSLSVQNRPVRLSDLNLESIGTLGRYFMISENYRYLEALLDFYTPLFQNSMAYNDIPGLFNTLQVFDIRELSAPRLLQSFSLSNPAGLLSLNKYLLVCDGLEAGLKVFSRDSRDSLSLLQSLDSVQCVDLMPVENSLDGFPVDIYTYSSEKQFQIRLSVDSSVSKDSADALSASHAPLLNARIISREINEKQILLRKLFESSDFRSLIEHMVIQLDKEGWRIQGLVPDSSLSPWPFESQKFQSPWGSGERFPIYSSHEGLDSNRFPQLHLEAGEMESYNYQVSHGDGRFSETLLPSRSLKFSFQGAKGAVSFSAMMLYKENEIDLWLKPPEK
jgi:hypothetical protein